MNYDIFDENYYLSRYQFVKEAVNSGIVQSGLEHFQKYGQKLGITQISRYYDEDYYLANNPGVAAAVKAGNFASGLDHFIQYGYEQGRANASPAYEETFYLKRHPGIVPFVQDGTFKSGFQHFIKFGAKAGLYATNFFEPRYLKDNSGVAAAVDAGIFQTGRDHYVKAGQFEPSRATVFTGTNSSDIVTSFGVGTHEIIGVQVALATANLGINPNSYESLGTNEFDTLIGSPGSDYFLLGEVVPLNRPSLIDRITFYTGNGEATIINFEKGKDYILLSQPPDQFNIFPAGGDLFIQKSGDTIAKIQGGANLNLQQIQATNPFNNPNVGYTLLG